MKTVWNKLWLLVGIALVLPGCGGSTSGTGGIITVSGNASERDGSALARARVEVLSTGDVTTSDDNGNYSLQVSDSVIASGLSLRLTDNGTDYFVEIAVVPEDTSQTQVNIIVEGESVSSVAVSYFDENGEQIIIGDQEIIVSTPTGNVTISNSDVSVTSPGGNVSINGGGVNVQSPGGNVSVSNDEVSVNTPAGGNVSVNDGDVSVNGPDGSVNVGDGIGIDVPGTNITL